MKNKAPAFQFYAQDFMMGTLRFSAEQVGGYIRLLIHQWDQGLLPNDDKTLIQLSGLKRKSLPLVKKKFVVNTDGFLQNQRLEKVRRTQLEYRESQRIKSERRWAKTKPESIPRHTSGICPADALHLQSSTSTSTSTSTSSSLNTINTRATTRAAFKNIFNEKAYSDLPE